MGKSHSTGLYHIGRPVNNNRICCDWAPCRAEINTFLANYSRMGWYNSHAVVTHRLEIHHGHELPKGLWVKTFPKLFDSTLAKNK